MFIESFFNIKTRIYICLPTPQQTLHMVVSYRICHYPVGDGCSFTDRRNNHDYLSKQAKVVKSSQAYLLKVPLFIVVWQLERK